LATHLPAGRESTPGSFASFLRRPTVSSSLFILLLTVLALALIAAVSFGTAARGASDAHAKVAPAGAAERAGLQAGPPIRVTGASPYPASCGATTYPDTEVEFSLTADRDRPERLVGTWIQHAPRAPAVAYSRDGGRAGTSSSLPDWRRARGAITCAPRIRGSAWGLEASLTW
jgi:hypothetical protein